MEKKPKYDPSIHNRRSIRLKGFDYSQAGSYFITICCHNRKSRFGYVKNGKMILNEFGRIAHNEWINLADRFPEFELSTFQIMPNHMHAIIRLTPTPAAAQADLPPAPIAAPSDLTLIPITTPPASISNIIGAYKSIVANKCLEIYKASNKTMGKLWHRNYYDIIIRNPKAHTNIENYIIKNPAKWATRKTKHPSRKTIKPD